MRDNLKRVCIIFPEDLIQLADEYKNKYHGSRSQLLREALIEYVERLEKEEDERAEMRPLVRKLEDLGKSVERIDNKVGKFRSEAEFSSGGSQKGTPKLASEIERLLLEKGEALTVPEMGEYLPYEQEELIEGVEWLEENFAVERIEPKNVLTKWRIRGYEYG
ncbi:hypothetical protein AKJ58_00595 [candidate division MSBL1 archaeon SCGC-AAA385D11]|uniref:Uncharacterized protein n=1 Tax=candidate division MSBL1 archaeon SCGC-AAA385D11 TaxID=1698286 RepID=A0A133VP19_9EURY|nr:hypothetical protein AKJ58_00595 [candidate division MSBL1 archaeon SCGC-AAA385D11]